MPRLLVSRLNGVRRLIDNDICQSRGASNCPDQRHDPTDKRPAEKDIYNDDGTRVLLIPGEDGGEEVESENYQEE